MHYSYDIIVIGGGQAGLAMGYELARMGRDFIILDAALDIGDAWRNRWDSLRLFTPARHCALPGMPFPADADHLPTKDEVADYLETYARHFALPIVHDERVISLRRIAGADGYIVETMGRSYSARDVIVATGPFTTPRIPSLARGLAPDVVQMHSTEYRRPSQLPDGPVLVVGGGSSGVQIAAELAATRRTYLAVGTRNVRLPQRVLGTDVFTILDRVGALDVPIDSRLGARMSRREVVIEDSPATVARRNGVELLDRIVGAGGRVATTLSARRVEVSAVIWATGFDASYPWIDVPVFDDAGRPRHHRGVTGSPGLFFLGLPWMHTRGSALLGWVGRDAAHLAAQIAKRPGSASSRTASEHSPSDHATSDHSMAAHDTTEQIASAERIASERPASERPASQRPASERPAAAERSASDRRVVTV